MDNNEFEARFDVLYNNITSNQAPGLNTYEKSVFLTKAQDELLKNYFNPKGNKYQEGFDDSAKRQIDFSKITQVYTKSAPSYTFGTYLFDARAKSVELPSDVMMFINEQVTVTRDNDTSNDVLLTVVPISFDEYNRLMSKPYKRPLKDQAWRLISYTTSNKADLICGPGDVLKKYAARYIRRPQPIILGNLDGLRINGIGTTTQCELDESLHEEILQRAVELAKVAWTTTGQENLQPVMQAGQRSE